VTRYIFLPLKFLELYHISVVPNICFIAIYNKLCL